MQLWLGQIKTLNWMNYPKAPCCSIAFRRHFAIADWDALGNTHFAFGHDVQTTYYNNTKDLNSWTIGQTFYFPNFTSPSHDLLRDRVNKTRHHKTPPAVASNKTTIAAIRSNGHYIIQHVTIPPTMRSKKKFRTKNQTATKIGKKAHSESTQPTQRKNQTWDRRNEQTKFWHNHLFIIHNNK